MSITALPTPPQRSDPTNFPTRADTFLSALPTFGTEANALAADVNAKQLAAATSATNAATSEANAATSAATATTQAGIASAAVASGSGSPAWVSGTTYAVGDVRYSPADFRSYRRITAGAGTTDPSLDQTNWLVVSNSGTTLLYVRDEKSSGTDGGASIAGTQQRTLNTVVVNSIAGASLATDIVTLPKGTYDFNITIPVFNCNRSQGALVNITDNITYVGNTTLVSAGVAIIAVLSVVGRFTIASAKTFKVMHYTQSAYSAGLGVAASSGFGTEVYTEARFTKVI